MLNVCVWHDDCRALSPTNHHVYHNTASLGGGNHQHDEYINYYLRLGDCAVASVCVPVIINKKLSYRRETARQLPTWRGG